MNNHTGRLLQEFIFNINFAKIKKEFINVIYSNFQSDILLKRFFIKKNNKINLELNEYQFETDQSPKSKVNDHKQITSSQTRQHQ